MARGHAGAITCGEHEGAKRGEERTPSSSIITFFACGAATALLFALILFYLVLGMFVESIAMMLMTLPVTYPIAMALGLDPVWFGIFLVLMIEIGLITPPVGMVLFVLRSMNARAKFTDIMSGALPFVVLMLSFAILLYAYPQIVMWLPQQVK